MSRRARAPRALAVMAAALLGGCAVGPDFTPPPAPATHGYGVAAFPPTASIELPGGAAQQLVPGRDIPGQWWTLFHSRPLNDLLGRALEANPDIEAAQAALDAEREQVLAQRGAYLPSLDAALAANRQKTSAELAPTPNSGALYFALHTAQVSVSYVPDVFGLNRRTVESLSARAEQARFALAATHLTLTSNLAMAAVQEASLRAQIAATRALMGLAADSLRIVSAQFARGYASRLDVAAQDAQLAQVSATLPALLKQLAQQRHLLAALSGALPDAEPPEIFELSGLELPQELPLSLPSRLVEQRPDVLQAQANLHAASAQIGIAVANRLPNITLSANLGSAALAAGGLFAGGTEFWDVGGGLSQPLWHGGALVHQQRAAQAAYREAAAQYRGTVLAAFQNVADTLAALEHDADGLRAAVAAEQAAGVTLELTRRQQQAGYAGSLALLIAQQSYQQALLARTQAQASRYADTVALFQALGGGWWNSEVARD